MIIDNYISRYQLIMCMNLIISGLMRATLTTLLPWTDLYTKDANGTSYINKELNEYEIRSILRAHKSPQSSRNK